MPNVHLSLDQRRQFAVVAVSDDSTTSQWSKVRRLYEERSNSAEVEGRRIALPWWEFVAHRDSLKFVLKIERLSFSADEPAKYLLSKAVQREAQYRRNAVEQRVCLSGAEVNARLKEIGFTRELLPYQARNVSNLCHLLSGATFSVPGAGKTTEALAYFFLNRQPEEKMLVVAPKNAFVAWEEELPICLPSYPGRAVRLVGGSDNIRNLLLTDPEVAIISYHQLPYVVNDICAYLSRNMVCVMLDESHRMKRGEDGVHGACLLNVSHLPCRKLILSGTPMPQGPADLVPQFNFLFPEIRTDASSVTDSIQSCFVRTTKSELGLPPVRRILKEVNLPENHRLLYDSIATDIGRHLAGLNARDRLSFRSIGRCVQYLLQAASNPALLAKTQIGQHDLLRIALAEGPSVKLIEACRMARALANDGKKVLIWSTFVNTVENISSMLTDVGAESIHGGVSTDEDDDNFESREAIIRRFNDPDSRTKVLVANPAACSEGISLHHVCHHAIYVDRNYNAAQYLQSEDRIHRIGLREDVETYVTILTSPNTIDESVSRRLSQKVDNMRDVLNDPNLNIIPVSLEDASDGLDVEDIEDLKRFLGIS